MFSPGSSDAAVSPARWKTSRPESGEEYWLKSWIEVLKYEPPTPPIEATAGRIRATGMAAAASAETSSVWDSAGATKARPAHTDTATPRRIDMAPSSDGGWRKQRTVGLPGDRARRCPT